MVKGVKYTVTEDLTLGGGHTLQYTGVPQKWTLKAYIVLLATVTQTNLI